MGRKKNFDEDEALLKALRLFWTKGYKQTSVEDLQRAMGVQKGSFYLHYRSKQNLFLMCLQRYRAEVVGARKLLVKTAGDPKQGLRLFFSAWTQNNKKNPRLAGCLNTNSLVELGRENSIPARYLSSGLESWEEFWKEFFESTSRQRKVRMSSGSAALLTVSFTQGLNVLARAGVPQSKLDKSIESFFELLFTS